MHQQIDEDFNIRVGSVYIDTFNRNYAIDLPLCVDGDKVGSYELHVVSINKTHFYYNSYCILNNGIMHRLSINRMARISSLEEELELGKMKEKNYA